MDSFTIIFTLLGGLGVFFFGMKLLSDGLQAMTGDLISKIIKSVSSNRFKAIGAGLIVTGIIQSSSVTTVMTVGLVNAGLLTLKQAIGVIFGANIGTTVTGWLLSMDIAHSGIALVGIGFIPGLFSKNQRSQFIGQVVMGVGLLFIGLETLTNAFMILRTSPVFLENISFFTGQTTGSYFAAIIVGCILTMIFQSSIAVLALTMALAFAGVVNFQTAVALVLGENVGKTITAILASLGGNVNAKRAAQAHALFNVLGVVIIFSVFPLFFNLVEVLVPNDADFMTGDGMKPFIITHIAMAHTLFNLIATILFVPFLNQLAALLSKINPDKEAKDTPHLLLLGDPQTLLPATSMAQAENEIKKMAEIVSRMFKLTREYWTTSDVDPKVITKILDYERITDNIHKEVTVFLCYVMEKQLSHHQSEQTQSLIKIADELESVADYIERLATYKERFHDGERLEGDSEKEFHQFMDEIWDFYQLTVKALEVGKKADFQQISVKSEELLNWADSMRDKHLERIAKGVYRPLTALTYSDMVVALRKIRTHAFHMARAVDVFYQET